MNRKRSDIMIYASLEDYESHYTHTPIDIDELARKASRDIDTLTHCRINGIGWDNLTEYQQDTITEVCCDMINFADENRDILDSVLSSYSINGVSMQFKFNPTVFVQDGIIMRLSTYSRLVSTGLCYAGGL